MLPPRLHFMSVRQRFHQHALIANYPAKFCKVTRRSQRCTQPPLVVSMLKQCSFATETLQSHVGVWSWSDVRILLLNASHHRSQIWACWLPQGVLSLSQFNVWRLASWAPQDPSQHETPTDISSECWNLCGFCACRSAWNVPSRSKQCIAKHKAQISWLWTQHVQKKSSSSVMRSRFDKAFQHMEKSLKTQSMISMTPWPLVTGILCRKYNSLPAEVPGIWWGPSVWLVQGGSTRVTFAWHDSIQCIRSVSCRLHSGAPCAGDFGEVPISPSLSGCSYGQHLWLLFRTGWSRFGRIPKSQVFVTFGSLNGTEKNKWNSLKFGCIITFAFPRRDIVSSRLMKS